MSESKLWTLSFQGGIPFSFSVAGNPGFQHNGRSSAQHLVITSEEALRIRGLGILHGCNVQVSQMPGPSAEQARTKALLQMGPERVWPTPQCPQCPWLDPRYEGDPCGLVSEFPEVVTELLESSERRRKASEDCPR